MTRTAAIVQSSYIPWKGYFDLINLADELILYDDVQYTRRDWRNRNRIKHPNGLQWLTIPVEVKGKYLQRICDTRVSEPDWARKHWQTLSHSYARAAHFREYRDRLEELYLGCEETLLSTINYRFIAAVCDVLGITTRITWSMSYPQIEGRSERLLGLCKSVGCDRYLSGPSAAAYLDVDLFKKEGVDVVWMDYSGYPEYPQLHGPFEHAVTILDLILNTGPEARSYMKSFGRSPGRQAA